MNLLEIQKKYQEENKRKQEEQANITEKNNNEIELEKLVDFRKGQPFSIYTDLEKEQMKQSIKENGIINPIIIRKIDEEKYEIISGHNRVKCCRELGLKKIPCIIKNCNDDEATLIMIDSNLCNREKILPVEKGYAYKRKNDILKNGVNLSDTNTLQLKFQNGTEDGKTQIYRFIRLTYLIKNLQEKVNKEQLSVNAGVEISYLSEEKQEIVNTVIEEKKIKLSVVQAQKIKMLKNNITYEIVINIIENKKVKIDKFTGKLEKRAIKIYKDKFKNNKEFTDLILELLENYFENKNSS